MMISDSYEILMKEWENSHGEFNKNKNMLNLSD